MNRSVDNLIVEFRQRLLDWGFGNTQNYPWRWVDDPYCVLVSEFMLHRTQTKQVIFIYKRFIELCPNLETFMRTDENQIRDILTSLGLQWRINAMLEALSHLWNCHAEVPTDEHLLMSVNGIGQYIANATICFTLDRPVTLIDTNTVRVIGRVFGLDLTGEARRRKTVIEAISAACDPDQPRDYYYALIDFAHQVCRPRTSDCASCPLLNLPCKYGNTITGPSFHGDES